MDVTTFQLLSLVASCTALLISYMVYRRQKTNDTPEAYVEDGNIVHLFNPNPKPFAIDSAVAIGGEIFSASWDKCPVGYTFDEGAHSFGLSIVVYPKTGVIVRMELKRGEAIKKVFIKKSTLYMVLAKG